MEYNDYSSSNVKLLYEALNIIKEAVDRTAAAIFAHDDHRAEYLSFECIILRALYKATSQKTYLDESISVSRLSLDVAIIPSPLRPLCATNLSDSLAERYLAHGAGSPAGLEAALGAAREAVKASNEGEDDEYLDEAIQIGRQLVRVGTGTRGIYLMNLAADLKHRFERYGGLDDLRQSQRYLKTAVEGFPSGHANHLAAVRALSDCEIDISRLYNIKHEILSNPEDLDRAIGAAEQCLSKTSRESAGRASTLMLVSNVLSKRAESRLSTSDMDLAVDYAMQAVALSTALPAQQSSAYTTLGNCLSLKYTTFGGLHNMEESLDARRQAVNLLARNHRDRPSRVSNLAIGLRDHFEYYGDIAFLDESISLQRQACGIDNHNGPDRCMILSGLTIALSHRCRLTGSSQDLQEAISASEAAVEGSRKGGVHRPAYLNNLATVLSRRFDRQLHRDDSERATSAISEAVDAVADDVTYLTTLSNCLLSRYDFSGNRHDLEKAVQVANEVVSKTPKSRPSRLGALYSLGGRIYKQYEDSMDKGERLSLLRKAFEIAEECVRDSPANHPDLPNYLRVLAKRRLKLALFMDESDKPKLLAQLRVVAMTYQHAFDQRYDTPIDRVESGRCAGYAYMQLKDWEIASEILSEAVNLFRRVSPSYLDGSDRQRQLNGLSGISSLACAAYFSLDKPEPGIEILEAGRGIMANIAMGYHADLSPIRQADQVLYRQYVNLRDFISQPLVTPSTHGVDVVGKRMSNLRELEEVEEKIRSLHGLESFNRSLTVQQMRGLAAEGPIVSFCTVDQRCDAIIITEKSVQYLPLPKLRNADIKLRIPLVVSSSRLSMAKPTQWASANKRMRGLLSWLWESAVRPVLEQLGLLQITKTQPLTRLWWVMSGPLGLLPLHAAGRGHQENVYNHVISSYTPSLAALAFARQCEKNAETVPAKAALITMPQTPGGLSALSTESETQAIYEVLQSNTGQEQIINLCQPNASDVLHNMRSSNANILHLACHAEPDLKDPSNSALLFGSDPQAASPESVPIRELMQYNGSSETHQRPLRLAYLSACCTAQQYDLRLIDENLHLAAAFQLLGFPAVVGSLWEADDAAATLIAGEFYAKLLVHLNQSQQGHHAESQLGESVATALHLAISAFRQRKVARGDAADDVLSWASFVHLGA
ncbi:CHAT domain-containing protein [Delphinella strobiligena]|nr:CHAT domain-containing protein [Delphinella strobiligena]